VQKLIKFLKPLLNTLNFINFFFALILQQLSCSRRYLNENYLIKSLKASKLRETFAVLKFRATKAESMYTHRYLLSYRHVFEIKS